VGRAIIVFAWPPAKRGPPPLAGPRGYPDLDRVQSRHACTAFARQGSNYQAAAAVAV